MSVQACAEILRKGDPDRFLAVMAAPAQARATLFPLYAFNVEVARAPWVTAEPLIAEMRLQWWRDALGEIAAGGVVRRHEVAVPLAHVLRGETARALIPLIDARAWDIGADPFTDEAALGDYLANTGGRLLSVAARALGAPEAEAGRATALGCAGAWANYLLAVPALIAAGKQPLPLNGEPWIARLSGEYLDRLGQGARGGSPPLRHAALSAWRARAILRRAQRDPGAVLEGRLGGSEFARRAGLIRATVFGV